MSDSEEPETVQAKPKRRRREPMPDMLKARAQASIRAHKKRWPVPDVAIVKREGSWSAASPYRSADEADWWALFAEAFGTRTVAVIDVFVSQLAGLVGSEWDPEARCILPDESQMRAACAIVASLKPKNEAEAAQAAQLVALHLASMKVGARVAGGGSFVDPRQANALAALVKSYALGMDSLRRGRTRGATRQTIKVTKNVTINDNRRVTVRGGGVPAADQPDGATGNTRARAEPDAGRTCTIEGVVTLPSPAEMRGTVPGASDEGPQGVPRPRREVAGRSEG